MGAKMTADIENIRLTVRAFVDEKLTSLGLVKDRNSYPSYWRCPRNCRRHQRNRRKWIVYYLDADIDIVISHMAGREVFSLAAPDCFSLLEQFVREMFPCLTQPKP
jgi:hypothetical protein